MIGARRILLAAMLAWSGVAGAARFSFRAIEYAPAADRLPAAQAYVARQAAPGTPMAVAIAAMRRAETGCRRRPARDGAIVCRYSRVASDSADDLPAGDVTWTVRLFPAADGSVARATVARYRTGP